jgi:nucleoside-diphosphate-sugar epimerase
MQGCTSLWRGRRVLVTGCNGFLGAAVTRELLNRQAHVIALMHDRNAGKLFSSGYDSSLFHIAQGRLEDASRIYTLLAIHEVTAIFHLIETPSQAHGTGLPVGMNRPSDDRGTAAILRAAALLHPRLPVILYRPSSQLRIQDADSPAGPHGIARFGELFGPEDRSAGIIPLTIAGLLAGERINAQEGPARDFVYVRDAARACLSLAESVAIGSSPLDITFHSGWELNDAAMAGFTSAVFYGREANISNFELPTNPIGWQPVLSFGDALAETIEWYRNDRYSRSIMTRSIDPLRRAA